jgi:SAP domain-containing new25
MTEEAFDNGYWYAIEIKTFAHEIGIQFASKLRKDEIETLIKHYLRTGRVRNSNRKILSQSRVKDVEKGLALALPVVRYTNDNETKEFIVKEALKIAPNLKRKSGARYRLNRWREERIDRGIKITYQDLIQQYVSLNQIVGIFPRVPSGRYINFLSDFLAKEKNSTRERAIRAWKQLKKANIPKTYRDWKGNRGANSRKG